MSGSQGGPWAHYLQRWDEGGEGGQGPHPWAWPGVASQPSSRSPGPGVRKEEPAAGMFSLWGSPEPPEPGLGHQQLGDLDMSLYSVSPQNVEKHILLAGTQRVAGRSTEYPSSYPPHTQ